MPLAQKNRDLLPSAVKKRREVLQVITSVFEKNGYREIVTPTFEDFDAVEKALPKELIDASYRFFDHDGVQKILRPDITTQLARVVGSKLKDEKGPLRLFYTGDVYRAQEWEIGQGNQFHQVGVELFDLPGNKGDAEVVALAEKCLDALGLRDHSIMKTNVAKVNRLAKDKQQALHRQDFVAYGRLPKPAELLSVDIGYYTGLYFECFVPGLGYILGSGGRYDNLCGCFGKSRKAVGFAFNLDKLVRALEKK